jgi:hypothetical protein
MKINDTSVMHDANSMTILDNSVIEPKLPPLQHS